MKNIYYKLAVISINSAAITSTVFLLLLVFNYTSPSGTFGILRFLMVAAGIMILGFAVSKILLLISAGRGEDPKISKYLFRINPIIFTLLWIAVFNQWI